MRTPVAAACAAALLALPAPAGAATVTGATVIEPGVKGPDVTVLDVTVTGDPAEGSAITLTAAGTTVTLTDTAAPLHAAGTCTQATPTRVICAGAAAQRLKAELGD